MDNPRFPHLGLTDWPFFVVPDIEHSHFLADRKEVRAELDKILTLLSRKEQSSIYVLWAWFGAGKTHTLYYVSNLCRTRFPSYIPIYNELPKDTRSFIDLYKGFINGVDLARLEEAYLEVFTSPRQAEIAGKLSQEFPDLFHALKALIMETEAKAAVAGSWLRAENVSARDLKSISVAERIDRPEKALLAISWIVHLFQWSSQTTPNRVIWMIDEFQRITRSRQPVQDQINGCLQSVFNRCPKSFTLILSFSGNPSKKLPSWLSKELSDRIGMERVITLPPLGPGEAHEFVLDVLSQYRNSGFSRAGYFPFTKDGVDAVVNHVKQKAEIKPRSVMQACNAVLEEADLRIERGEMEIIDHGFVTSVLKDRTFVETEDEETE